MIRCPSKLGGHWIAALVAAVFVATQSPLRGEDKPASPAHPLIVHEWGTFTSFSGSDGVQLDYRPLVDNDLPEFIYSDSSLSPFTKRRIFARQRMETPVTYFYSDIERDVRVSVSFPKGRLTEYYPPPLPTKQVPSLDGAPTTIDTLDWGTVHLIPEKSLTTQVANPKVADRLNRHISSALVPWMDNYNPYYEARRTDSTLLYVRRENKPEEYSSAAYDFQGDHFEKFLFYRGTGQFELPVRVEALGSDRVRIRNLGGQEIRSAFLVENNGETFRSRFVGHLPPESVTETSLRPKTDIAGTDVNADLIPQLTSELVAAGLYEKEATAMVNTWQSAWFSEPGMRLFFFVPEDITEKVLPLKIEPKPDQTVRVLVARMEFMSPEEERNLQALIGKSAENREANEPALMEELKRRGRLAEPAVQYVGKGAKDEAVRAEAERVRNVLLSGG
jgi:hypothetical protein